MLLLGERFSHANHFWKMSVELPKTLFVFQLFSRKIRDGTIEFEIENFEKIRNFEKF